MVALFSGRSIWVFGKPSFLRVFSREKVYTRFLIREISDLFSELNFMSPVWRSKFDLHRSQGLRDRNFLSFFLDSAPLKTWVWGVCFFQNGLGLLEKNKFYFFQIHSDVESDDGRHVSAYHLHSLPCDVSRCPKNCMAILGTIALGGCPPGGVFESRSMCTFTRTLSF